MVLGLEETQRGGFLSSAVLKLDLNPRLLPARRSSGTTRVRLDFSRAPMSSEIIGCFRPDFILSRCRGHYKLKDDEKKTQLSGSWRVWTLLTESVLTRLFSKTIKCWFHRSFYGILLKTFQTLFFLLVCWVWFSISIQFNFFINIIYDIQ